MIKAWIVLQAPFIQKLGLAIAAVLLLWQFSSAAMAQSPMDDQPKAVSFDNPFWWPTIARSIQEKTVFAAVPMATWLYYGSSLHQRQYSAYIRYDQGSIKAWPLNSCRFNMCLTKINDSAVHLTEQTWPYRSTEIGIIGVV